MDLEKPIIRTATRKEREWAAGIMAGTDPWIRLGVSLERCRTVCLNPEFLVLVARLDGKPVGAIVFHKAGLAGSPYVRAIVVEKAFRSRGLGAALIGRAEEMFRSEARHIFLCVSSFNRRAQALYKRLGYRKVGELPDYVVKGASELLMHKRLAPA